MLTSSKYSFFYNIELDIKTFEIQGRKGILNNKPKISCDITKQQNADLYADINVHLDTLLTCTRCLDDMQVVEDIKISGILSKEDKCIDLDVILIDDDYLDFDKIFYDAVFEHLNNNLYCKDDCRGLCHVCAINLNHQSCDCSYKNLNIDPRLEELKKFL